MLDDTKASAKREKLRAPFRYFGGKSTIAHEVWARFGQDRLQYIEPFCGSAAMLLAAPRPCSTERISDSYGFVANFWRAVKHQPDAVAGWADYPVSHIDLYARHGWLAEQKDRLHSALLDPDWHGDAKVAGWWLYEACASFGGYDPKPGDQSGTFGSVPNVSAQGIFSLTADCATGPDADAMLTSAGKVALLWLRRLSARLDRVQVLHGDWSRCFVLYPGTPRDRVAVFLDPPYKGFETLYAHSIPVASAVEAWARENADMRIALCGHIGDYDLPGWDVMQWPRNGAYAGGGKHLKEAIYFSPSCLLPEPWATIRAMKGERAEK